MSYKNLEFAGDLVVVGLDGDDGDYNKIARTKIISSRDSSFIKSVDFGVVPWTAKRFFFRFLFRTPPKKCEKQRLRVVWRCLALFGVVWRCLDFNGF